MTQGRKTRTIVITGASSGIGFALAKAYLDRGDNVVANARTMVRLTIASEKLGSPTNFLPVAGDIGAPETAKELFAQAIAKFGKVDVLINNAGIFTPKSFVQYSSSELEDLINTNLKGFFYPTKEAAWHMASNRCGHIISVTASIALQPNASVPAVLPILIKGGINQATKALAIELASQNVKVNAVAPGIVDTPLHSPENHDFLKTMQPVGRIGTTQEIVDAVMYLSEAKFTTGVVLPVDGGMSAGRW